MELTKVQKAGMQEVFDVYHRNCYVRFELSTSAFPFSDPDSEEVVTRAVKLMVVTGIMDGRDL